MITNATTSSIIAVKVLMKSLQIIEIKSSTAPTIHSHLFQRFQQRTSADKENVAIAQMNIADLKMNVFLKNNAAQKDLNTVLSLNNALPTNNSVALKDTHTALSMTNHPAGL